MFHYIRITLSFSAAALALFHLTAWAAEKRALQPQATASLSTQVHQMPVAFAKGEMLSYIALLNELPAGDGELRLHKEQQENREVYRATAQARTSELVDLLLHLSGTADGTFAANGFNPLVFRLIYSQRERSREFGVRYDPASKTLVGTTKKREQIKERAEPATGVYDPLSAFYLLRSHDLTPGAFQQVDVFTGKDRYRFTVHVVRREEVKLVSGVRPALRLHLESISLSDGSQRNLLPTETTAWVTPDEAHVPLKFESALPIGWFVMEIKDL
jgi:uncharacterized protein DUF3108